VRPTSVELLLLPLALVGVIPVIYLLVNSVLARKRRPTPARTSVPLSEVTVLVPVHAQEPETFRASIASIAGQGCDFVVVGDESLEPYRAMTQERGGRFLHLPQRAGKKRAIAAGLETVRTPFVVLVDSDTLLPTGAVEDLSAHFAPGVGGVGANLFVQDTGSPTAYCGEFVERAREVVLRAMSSRGSVLYLDGACSMYRTEVIRPFVNSPEFQDLRVLGRPSPLGDDWLLTDFLLREGYSAVKAYDVRATTQPRATFSEFVQQNVRWSRSNWIRLGRFLTGRGPRNRGAFFTFEVLGTYSLPLIALATLLVRIPLLVHAIDRAPLTLDGAGLVLLHTLVGLPHTMTAALTRLSLAVAGAFASGIYLGTLLRNSRHPALRMVAYGAVGTALLFGTAIYGLMTFWKRPRWEGPRPPAPLGSPASGTPRTDPG
jgi:cellulose synthase/poly-beta-1,6-N-acetylglucosamine synthase-like glycosyltransferase